MNQPSVFDILDKLIRFDTVSSRSNLEIIAFIADFLRSLGVSSATLPDDTGRKANLVASIGPVDQPGFVLSGHTDVVPVEGQDWTRDPFRLTREGDRLYGRGTTDMKGFLACMLARVPEMLAQPLRRPLHLVFSYDEEVGCLGVPGIVRFLGESVAPPLACFVGEPTGMGVVGGHKGSTGFLTTVQGKACHSSRPDLGVNAIFHAMDLIAELRRHADALKAAPDPGSPFELPYSTVSVGVIQGGTARNAIPGDIVFQWDIRATRPGVVDLLTRQFNAFAANSVVPTMREGFAASSVTTTMAYDVPPLVPVPDSLAETLAKRFAGRNETTTVNYGSEAGIFQAAGMPTAVCGPGFDSEAHITDEWIAVDQLARCATFLDGLIVQARQG